jgi:diacylglycerol kinase family enzyme
MNSHFVTGVAHAFATEYDYAALSFCNVCGDLIVGFFSPPVRCAQCPFLAHSECAAQAILSCRHRVNSNNSTSNHSNNSSVVRNQQLHHWVPGSTGTSATCAVCEKDFALSGHDAAHCSQCNVHVHNTKKSDDNDNTDAGCLAQLPPHCRPTHADLLLGHGSPLAVFVNPTSGGGQGHDVAVKLCRLLDPRQVWTIRPPEQLPEHGLARFVDTPNLRILVAGGDGTVNWVLNSMRKLPFATLPPIAVCPLGTGNDLAQSLGWIGVADRTGKLEDDLSAMLGEIVDAEVIDMDRWLVKVTDGAALPDGSTELFMTNYFSLGVDSQVALKFHELRQAHPELFISQSTNRAHYALLGFTTMFDGIECIGTRARLFCDDVELTLPDTIAGVIMLNIPSYAGGANLWGDDDDDDEADADADADDGKTHRFATPAVGDGLLEVVGVTSSAHMGLISVHLTNAIRLAQCSSIRVEFLDDGGVPFQVDGEPHLRGKSTVAVSRLPQRVPMLLRAQRRSSLEDSANEPPMV